MSAGPRGPEIVVAWIKASDCPDHRHLGHRWPARDGSNDIEVSDVFVPKHEPPPCRWSTQWQTARCSAFPWSDCSLSGWRHRRSASRRRRSMSCSASRERRRRLAWPRPCRPVRPHRSRSARPSPRPVRRALSWSRRPRACARWSSGRANQQTRTSAGCCGSQRHTRRPPALSIACTRRRRNSGLCLEPAPALPSRRARGHPAFFVAPQTYEMIGKILLGVEPDGFML